MAARPSGRMPGRDAVAKADAQLGLDQPEDQQGDAR
jgi:hypothetical protein